MEHFGIDFGTTNSAAVGWPFGDAGRFFGGRDTDRPLPSVVAINRLTGELHAIGAEARNHRENLSTNCEVISSVKTVLSDPNKHWTIGPRVWRPYEIAAEIIKELRKSISDRLAQGEKLMDSAVFSIPVGCSVAQRHALRKAARQAGIEVLSFISEPTAALCRHFKDVRKWPTVAVFDWGGGTLDISIVDIKGNVVCERATFGQRLGGDDLDHILAEYLHGCIMLQRGSDTPFTAVKPEYRDLLVQEAERAKIDLGSQNSVTINVPFYCGSPAIVDLSVETMLKLLQPLITQAFDALIDTIEKRAGCSKEQIGCLLMVGGSSKLRGLSETFLEKGWPNLIKHPPDADWNIAQGAAIIAMSPGDYVAGQDFGLAVSDGTYFPLIHGGTTISRHPVEHHFGLVEDSREARVVFVQPKGRNGHENGTSLETLGYLSLPTYGFSNEPILLKTWVDEDLVVNVRGHSDRRQAQVRNWHYEKLRLCYKLPELL